MPSFNRNFRVYLRGNTNTYFHVTSHECLKTVVIMYAKIHLP